jgi:hypothetical protein
MQSLTKSSKSPATLLAIEKLGQNTIEGLGPELEKLPRLFNRDQKLVNASLKLRTARLEHSLVVEKGLTEFALPLKDLEERSMGEALARIKKLAQEEVDEMARILPKLHIVEAEAIQRMHANPKIADKKDWGAEASGDVLVFPHRGEVWLDELDHYRVNAAGCPAKGGKVL